MDNKRLFSIILAVFIDLLGFSLALPRPPYYAKTFSANQTTTGILTDPTEIFSQAVKRSQVPPSVCAV